MNMESREQQTAHTDGLGSDGYEGQNSPPRRWGRWVGLASGLIVVVLVAGAVIGLSQRDMVAKGVLDPDSGQLSQALRSPLEAAYEDCGFDGADGASLADAGSTLILDTKGESGFFGLDYIEVFCVYAALEMPASVTNQISQTRALDGRVTDSWDVFTATWSYHPNSGLDLMITTD